MIPARLAVSLALAVAGAAAARGSDEPAAPKITGTIAYRERIALPDDALVRVRLEVPAAPEKPARRVAEVTFPTKGKQVPIPFELPYDASVIDPARRYAVRVTISAGDRVLFVTRTPYPALTKGAPAKLEILVQQAGGGRKPRVQASTTNLGLSGTVWRLVSLGDAPALALPEERAASLVFDGEKGRISGSTGCNRFTGTYEPGKDFDLALSPGGMTLMACPDDVTAQERAFLDALRAAKRYRIEGGTLELFDGERPVARFASGGAAPPSD